MMGVSPLVTAIPLDMGVPHFLIIKANIIPSRGATLFIDDMAFPISGSRLPLTIPGRFCLRTLSAYAWLIFLTSWGSWHFMGLEPASTMAFSLLEPITAPPPERAAMRPPSLHTPAIRDTFSPAVPITATEGFFLTVFSARRISSLSVASFPHTWEASLSCGPLLLICK